MSENSGHEIDCCDLTSVTSKFFISRRCLQGITKGSLLLTFCNRREPALQDGKPIENDLVHFIYRTRTMQINVTTLERFVFSNAFLNTSRDGSDVSIREQ